MKETSTVNGNLLSHQNGLLAAQQPLLPVVTKNEGGSVSTHSLSPRLSPVTVLGGGVRRRPLCYTIAGIFLIVAGYYYFSGFGGTNVDYSGFYQSFGQPNRGGDPSVVGSEQAYRIKFNSGVRDSESSGGKCDIPHPDPFDSTIRKYISTLPPLVCKRHQPDLTFLNDTGWLVFNISAAKSAGYTALDCSYKCFVRHDGVDDVTLIYDKPVSFGGFGSSQSPTPLSIGNSLVTAESVNCSDFVEVECHRSFPSTSIYSNLHSQIIMNRTRLNELRKILQLQGYKYPGYNVNLMTKNSVNNVNPNHLRPPDLLLFVIDSMSRLNFIRALPKTYGILTNHFQSIVFEGYSKVGDNSFPNAAAILVGTRQQVAGHKSDLPDNMADSFYDDWPIIWKNFSDSGYLTYYSEDYPNFNLFSYLAKGFRCRPTDHYFRPFWLALWDSYLHRRSSNLCYGNVPKHLLQLDYLRRFWTKYGQLAPDTPKFGLAWFTELSHDYLNSVTVGDDDLANFFENFNTQLENTILFVLSDHGHRFDAIRESVIGRIEERMPFLAIKVPEWIRTRYPKLIDNLRNNSNRLTSPFDVHATMKDVLSTVWHEKDPSSSLEAKIERSKDDFSQPKPNLTPRGLSLFRPISLYRQCEDASIPEDFCICQKDIPADITDPKVIAAAEALVNHVNTLLEPTGKKCAQLTLTEVRHAQKILPNAKMVLDSPKTGSVFFGRGYPTGFYVNFRVSVLVHPSEALLEGTLKNIVTGGSGNEPEYSVVGDVNRINRYGNQSLCINTPLLRKYCYCI